MRSPRPQLIELADDERSQLESWARRGAGRARRCWRRGSRIVLAAADGGSNSAIALRLGVSRTTVRIWRDRFAQRRLDGAGR